MAHFVPLGALSGPGAPDPDLARFHIRVKHGILNISLYVCKITNIVKNNHGGALLDTSTRMQFRTYLRHHNC